MARTKTFAGCWTCRRRKLKCDLARPSCLQCLRSGIECEGYGIRLTWEGAGATETRRNMGFMAFPNSMSYDTYDELDDALGRINHGAPSSDTLIEGPFGVFRADGIYPNQVSSTKVAMPDDFMQPSYPYWLANDTEEPHMLEFVRATTSALTQQYLEEAGEDLENSLFEQRAVANPLPFNPIQRPPALPHLALFTQYLLSAYHEYLMPYMSFIVHPKNIWRLSQTPRALSAIGDVLSVGRTSCTRACVLYSVTASTAYFIRDRYATMSSGFCYYDNLGQKLHNAAKFSIKQCLQGSNVGKYKDLLVALQSLQRTEHFKVQGRFMLNNVLDAMRQLIETRLSLRPNVSNKAMLLHRISAMSILLYKLAGYLPLCADGNISKTSTNCGVNEPKNDWIDAIFVDMIPPKSAAAASRDVIYQRMVSRQTTLETLSGPNDFENYLLQYAVEEPYYEAEKSTYDEILRGDSWDLTYGIPRSLAFLFKEAVMISRGSRPPANVLKNESYEHKMSLFKRCAIFEAALENWHRQYSPPMILAPVEEESVAGRQGICLALVNHHTLAFFEALVVYHYRVMKDVHPKVLQPRIQQIIEHLETISELVKTHNAPLICPPCFSGFIGACEVLETDAKLLERYISWFQNLSVSSPFDYADKIEIIREVHERRNLGENCGWWTVAGERGLIIDMY